MPFWDTRSKPIGEKKSPIILHLRKIKLATYHTRAAIAFFWVCVQGWTNFQSLDSLRKRLKIACQVPAIGEREKIIAYRSNKGSITAFYLHWLRAIKEYKTRRQRFPRIHLHLVSQTLRWMSSQFTRLIDWSIKKTFIRLNQFTWWHGVIELK